MWPQGTGRLQEFLAHAFVLVWVQNQENFITSPSAIRVMPSFYIFTLGCKVNQYESQAVREAWRNLGWVEVDEPGCADIILVNSCAVTQKAVSDVRNSVRRMHRQAPAARIVISGCAAEALPVELASLPGVTDIVPQKQKTALLGYDPLSSRAPADREPGPSTAPAFVDIPFERSGFPAFQIRGFSRSRAVLKIQDGCSHGCAYCIVPSTRGPARTRSLEDSLTEAGRLLEAGFGEIIVSGVNLRQYSEQGRDFWDFIVALEDRFGPEWGGRARFRISSLEPGQLDERALDILSRTRLVAPHLHLSLQSGSRAVLERMRRGHYKPESVAEFLASLKGIWPVFGLGADFISGFPGETEAEHEESRAMLQELPFSYAHVFPYSVRAGTVAAKMPRHVVPKEKKLRAAELRAIAEKKKKSFVQRMLALETVHVAPEGEEPETALNPEHKGTNEFYVDCVFDADAKAAFRNRGIVPARPVRVEDGRLVVEAR